MTRSKLVAYSSFAVSQRNILTGFERRVERKAVAGAPGAPAAGNNKMAGALPPGAGPAGGDAARPAASAAPALLSVPAQAAQPVKSATDPPAPALEALQQAARDAVLSSIPRIPRSALRNLHTFAEGNFGKVHEAEYSGTAVVLKELKIPDGLPPHERVQLVSAAQRRCCW